MNANLARFFFGSACQFRFKQIKWKIESVSDFNFFFQTHSNNVLISSFPFPLDFSLHVMYYIDKLQPNQRRKKILIGITGSVFLCVLGSSKQCLEHSIFCWYFNWNRNHRIEMCLMLNIRWWIKKKWEREILWISNEFPFSMENFKM